MASAGFFKEMASHPLAVRSIKFLLDIRPFLWYKKTNLTEYPLSFLNHVYLITKFIKHEKE